jgi:multisubunit Na+/H+ antiporter MnhB subunit
MAALIAIGAMLMILVGRRDETGLTAIAIAVIMIVAASDPQDAWRQPLLRLFDTIVGIVIGVACKWLGSFVFYRLVGERVR